MLEPYTPLAPLDNAHRKLACLILEICTLKISIFTSIARAQSGPNPYLN